MRYLSGKLLEILKNNLECLGACCNPSQNRRYRGLVQGYWNSQVTLSGATFSCSKRMLVAQPTRNGGVKKKCEVFWMFWSVKKESNTCDKLWDKNRVLNVLNGVCCQICCWKNMWHRVLEWFGCQEWSWILCPISSSLKAELFLILAFFQANHPVLEHGNGKPPFIIYSWFSH